VGFRKSEPLVVGEKLFVGEALKEKVRNSSLRGGRNRKREQDSSNGAQKIKGKRGLESTQTESCKPGLQKRTEG